jgi:hypothetical protein
LPDLINGACAAYVQHVACWRLGIVEPRGSAYAKPVSSIRAKELRDALDALRRHANVLQLRKRPVGTSSLVVTRSSKGFGFEPIENLTRSDARLFRDALVTGKPVFQPVNNYLRIAHTLIDAVIRDHDLASVSPS